MFFDVFSLILVKLRVHVVYFLIIRITQTSRHDTKEILSRDKQTKTPL